MPQDVAHDDVCLDRQRAITSTRVCIAANRGSEPCSNSGCVYRAPSSSNDLHYVTAAGVSSPELSTAFWCAGNHGPDTARWRRFVLSLWEWAVTVVGFKQTKNRLAKQGSSDVLDPPPATACPPCLAQHPSSQNHNPSLTSFILFCTDLKLRADISTQHRQKTVINLTKR